MLVPLDHRFYGLFWLVYFALVQRNLDAVTDLDPQELSYLERLWSKKRKKIRRRFESTPDHQTQDNSPFGDGVFPSKASFGGNCPLQRLITGHLKILTYLQSTFHETPRVSGADDRFVGPIANAALLPTSTGGQTHRSGSVVWKSQGEDNLWRSRIIFRFQISSDIFRYNKYCISKTRDVSETSRFKHQKLPHKSQQQISFKVLVSSTFLGAKPWCDTTQVRCKGSKVAQLPEAKSTEISIRNFVKKSMAPAFSG